jgi:hypothetical protein
LGLTNLTRFLRIFPRHGTPRKNQRKTMTRTTLHQLKKSPRLLRLELTMMW